MENNLIPSKFIVRRSPADSRDFKYQARNSSTRNLVDLREWDSLVEDQGKLGSCTGNAVTNAYELMVKHQYPDKFVELSRLFVYYNTRKYDNLVEEDAGAYIRDSLKSVKQYGVCSESLWPYAINKFNVKPTPECYADAKKRTITQYQAVSTIKEMIESIDDTHPLVVGMEVHESFMYPTQEDNVISMPEENERSIGGHAVCLIGYDLHKKQFLLKNSFGTDWGDLGYAWLPFEYIVRYSFEQWRFDISNQELILTS